MYKNKVGLEAEFFVRNDKSELVYPSTVGLGYDDFPLLAEVRGEPGETPEQTVGNFLTAFFAAKRKVTEVGYSVDLTGWAELTPGQYGEALKKSGTKVVPECANIYGKEMVAMSDLTYKKGELVSALVSAGLHIHFSSADARELKTTKEKYEPVHLKIKDLGQVTFWNRVGDEEKLTETISVSRLTAPAVQWIVKEMDHFPKVYSLDKKLKHRQPGWYELKDHGFEYRSLPFNCKVFDDLFQITCFAFDCLNKL